MIQLLILLLIACWLTEVAGNTEKVIFIAPEATSYPNDASLDNLFLTPLSHRDHAVRTYINSTFPSDDKPKGSKTWLLLQGLTPGQRYEVRVCWLATQPTSFWLHTHTVSEVFNDSPLLSSLSHYATLRRHELTQVDVEHLHTRSLTAEERLRDQSLLFLQIYAAADYYSLDKSLMTDVPPVLVDVILDPFLLNLVPQTLLPTIVYIIVTAAMAWLVATRFSSFILEILHGSAPSAKKVQ